jgi:phosphoglycerol transferase MdoB-like AlkP superfamily enzyme
MRTSIDTELQENQRLILGSISLLIFSVVFPIFLNYAYTLITKYRNNIKIKKIAPSRPILILILIFVAFALKTYYFASEILTESPLTTLSKSIAVNFSTRIFAEKKNITAFDDRIAHFSASISQHNQHTLINHRRKYNVILVILETTDTQFFNPDSHYTKYLPNLTKLAEEGLYFSNFYTPFPRSSKAFFAILTGYYPLTSYRSLLKISPNISIPSMFSILKHYKYNTFAAYSGDFNYDRMSDFLANRGVDRLVDINENDGTYAQISWGADDALIYDSLMTWLDTHDPNAPFFALLLPMNTHHPFWTPKEEYKIVSEHDQQGKYINAIHYQDHLIGKLISFLKTTNRWHNTTILITGDHGTVFNTLKSESNNASPYLIDKNTINVPLYLYSPNIKSKGIQYDCVASHIDILPTVLDLLGIDNGEQVQGRSLFDPTIKERVSFVYNDYYHQIVIGLTKDWNLMRDFSDHTTVLSKSLDFPSNNCSAEDQVCESLLEKVIEFNQFQDRRLLHFSK